MTLNLLESTLVQKFRHGSLESQIAEASYRVESALSMLGENTEHVILATFPDHVVALCSDGKVLRVEHSDPICKITEMEKVSPKATHFKSATRSVVESMMRGESPQAQVRSLAANVGHASAQMIWEHKVAPLMVGGDWNRYFEANEAAIRSAAWYESRSVRLRKASDWNLGGVEQALHEDLVASGRLLPLLESGSDIHGAVFSMLECGIAVSEGIKLLRSGHKSEEKSGDIIHHLLEYRGRIELINAYARFLASKRGS